MEILDGRSSVSAAQSHLDAGSAAQRAGHALHAAGHYNTALRIDPECAGALANLAVILADRRYLVAAVACIRRAVALVPGHPFFLATLGNVLLRMEHYEAAVQVLEMAIEIDPNQHGFWHNLGLALLPTNIQRAQEAFSRGIELAPDEKRIQRDHALVLLALGRWNDGFRELHRATDDEHGISWDPDVPEWRGQDLTRKTILVQHEQGFGDTIQFCRFLRQLRGSTVFLAVPGPLVRLMEVAPDIGDVVVYAEDLPPVTDYQTTVMSALRYLDVEKTILEPQSPYLTPPDYGPRIRRGPNTILAVGVCWAGSPNHGADHLRSMLFENFLSIADIPGVQVYSLQKGDAAKDVERNGGVALIPDLSGMIGDFADLAYVINQLDLVVSVDTSVLHLAGALGKKCIALLPYCREWRWGRRTDATPFYPTMRLITQERPGDWVGVMVRVRQAIAEILETPEE